MHKLGKVVDYLTQIDFAARLGISRQAVSQGIKTRRVHVNGKKIDPDHPTNLYFAQQVEKHKSRGAPGVKRKTEPPPTPVVEVELPAAIAEPVEPDTGRTETGAWVNPRYRQKVRVGATSTSTSSTPSPVDVQRERIVTDHEIKLKEEIRWKRAQADLKTIEYSQKMEILVDRESLIKKFNSFFDLLLNDLIYLPESSADILWSRAKASATPEHTLEEDLKDRIAEVIAKAKAAALEITAPPKSTKYIFEEVDE